MESARDSGGIGDAPLAEFQGPDGLTRLLEMLAEQRFPTTDLLELIKRIHTPGYEHARLRFRDAVAAGVLENNVPYGYWRQEDLQRVLDLPVGE